MSSYVNVDRKDVGRLVRYRALVRRVLETTVCAVDCEPRGSFKIRRDEIDDLFDLFRLVDALCETAGAAAWPRGQCSNSPEGVLH